MNAPASLEKIRAFVAIHLPHEILSSLRRAQISLESAIPKNSVRWTPPEQLHLTLKFLGHISANALAEVETSLEEIGRSLPQLRLHAERLGCFPGPSRPRVIWVGLGG